MSRRMGRSIWVATGSPWWGSSRRCGPTGSAPIPSWSVGSEPGQAGCSARWSGASCRRSQRLSASPWTSSARSAGCYRSERRSQGLRSLPDEEQPMPDLPESSTPVNLPTPDEGEPPEELASPPLVNPDDFDLYDVFRETFLRRFTRREDNAALRTLARLLLEMTCEFQHWWPDAREGDVRTLLRAVIADLRYLQGSLALT